MWADYDHEDTCPACSARFDGIANMMGIDRPRPGDRCVCLYCQSINVMGWDGKLRLPTEAEAIEHAADPELQEAVWAMRMLGPPPSRR